MRRRGSRMIYEARQRHCRRGLRMIFDAPSAPFKTTGTLTVPLIPMVVSSAPVAAAALAITLPLIPMAVSSAPVAAAALTLRSLTN